MLIRTSKDKDHPYVMLNKTFLLDPNLSLKAKGLLTYCMCMPDGWQFYVSQMVTVLKEKHCSIYAGFKELIKFGYCIRTRVIDEKGKVVSYDYVLFEVPQNQQPDDEKSPLRGFPLVDNPLVENPMLVIKEPKVINDPSNTHMPSDFEKSSKKKSIPSKVCRKEFVHTSDEEHEKLVKKYGLILTESAYVYLNDWKASKLEAEPRKAQIHTDYYRITKWVIKALQEEEINQKKPAPMSNMSLAKEKFTHGRIYNGAECYISGDGIAFQRGMTNLSVRFSEKGFKEQFENILRKLDIKYG